MKKIVSLQKKRENRKLITNWDLSEEMYDINYQSRLINMLYLDDDFENKTIIQREIQKKINGYKNQDKKKNKYDNTSFISIHEVLELLVISKLKCYYCSCKMYLVYKEVRENKQWTLDRIDNNIGHNNGNVVGCCLQCNLKRRTTNDKKFLFTKKMKIIKNN